jgi:pilus assembly protein Flp/PilA
MCPQTQTPVAIVWSGGRERLSNCYNGQLTSKMRTRLSQLDLTLAKSRDAMIASGRVGLKETNGTALKQGRSQTGQEPLMTSFVKRFAQDESGVTAIEYGLIAAGIGVAILTVVNTTGKAMVSIFTTVATDLTTAAK